MSPETRIAITNFLQPLCLTEANRTSILNYAFVGNPVLFTIDLSGAAATFVTNLLATLEKAAPSANGDSAIWTLLMGVYGKVGLDWQQKIESWRTEVNPRTTPAALEPVGGAVPLHSHFYIHRAADASLTESLERQDGIVLVRGVRQMGKTSLLLRGLERAKSQGLRIVSTDLQRFDQEDLSDPNQFYSLLAERFYEDLKLRTHPEDTWKPKSSGKRNFEVYLRDTVIGSNEKPVVWALDEADRLFDHPLSSDFFGLLRANFNDRARGSSSPWSRLMVLIGYATKPDLFIQDLNQSPFNVGTDITMSDFTPIQVSDLNQRYGSPLITPAELSAFYELTGGQPYLVQRGLHHLVSERISLQALEPEIDRGNGVFGNHLRSLRTTLQRNAELENALHQHLCRAKPLTTDNYERLQSGGFLSVSTSGLRCQVYERYLRRHLCEDSVGSTGAA